MDDFKGKKKLDKGCGTRERLVKTKTKVNTTKIFLIELQRLVVVKVELNC